MKRIICSSLLFFSSSVFAHTSMPPSFTVELQQMFQISADTSRFVGWFTFHENGGVITALTTTSGVDFGDGQSFSNSGTSVSVNHTYAPGSFTAVMTLSAIGEWRDTTSFTNNGEPPLIVPINFNFQKSLVVSHMPEPETYAMLLAGLGLLGFMARRRKQNAD